MVAKIYGLDEPENESERFALRHLRSHLPDNYLIIHNLILDIPYKHAFEYDIIVIGEFAVYHVEVKGYRGRIEANRNEWLLLDSNEERKSPFNLAEKKSKALASLINRHLPNQKIWVETIVFLTDERASIKWVDGQERPWLHFQNSIISQLTDRTKISTNRPFTSIGDNFNSVLNAITNNTYFDRRRFKETIREFTKIEMLSSNHLYTSYQVRHQVLQTNKIYKLKVYHFDIYQDEKTRNRQKEHIQREAIALHTLQHHPNIVQAQLPFWHEGDFVLPLEWVGGVSLRSLFDQKKVLSLRGKLEIARQIGDALEYAHNNRIIHRDLRPENIIISPNRQAKVINFDLARIESQDMPTLSISMDIKLHEAYIAPEVWERASNASPRSDMFSWGIILFEMLTGRQPYKKIDDFIRGKQLPRNAVDLLRNLPLSEKVYEILQRSCAFSKTDRYESMKEPLQLLDELLIDP